MSDEPTDEHVARAQAGWAAAEATQAQRDPSLGFYKDHAEKSAAEELELKRFQEARAIMDAQARVEEARLQRDKMKQGYTPVGSTGPRQLVGRTLGGVAMRAIEWLWTGWIPKGYITLLAGETGSGKTTVLVDVVSRVTTGSPWPGEHDCPNAWRNPERVLWLGSEDSIEEMTIPRLVACGGNRESVIEIQGVMQDGKRNTFSLQDDIEQVADWLTIARDEGSPFAMLVIDPVTSYLPGQKLRKVDLNDAGQLRTVLEPWLILAQQFNVAIVCVTHFAKATDRSMLNRVLGSTAFTATCRSLIAVMERQPTEDYEPEPHEKPMMQVKMNLPEHPGGAWKFCTEKVTVDTDPRNGKPITATRPVWDELDSALKPSTVTGKQRGPKSQYEPAFAMWFQAYMMSHPNDGWIAVTLVKLAALQEKVVSASWWDKHSGDHMEKQNFNGTWMCRPKQAP